MIGRLIGSAELKQLASFVTPAFFDVMPAKELFARAKTLRAATKDAGAFRDAVTRRQAALLRADLPITVLAERPASTNDVAAIPPERQASAVVELYFHQLFGEDPILMDLRRASFFTSEGRLGWRPATWTAELSPDFVGALRRVYRGFYTANDAEFRAGLSTLDLLDAEDVFREQFGADVHAVTFHTSHFISTFHEVFVRCKRQKKALHPDFLPLGIYLAALYEHLEQLNVTVDVACCFARATGSTESK